MKRASPRASGVKTNSFSYTLHVVFLFPRRRSPSVVLVHDPSQNTTTQVCSLGVDDGSQQSGEDDLRGGELQVRQVGQVVLETSGFLRTFGVFRGRGETTGDTRALDTSSHFRGGTATRAWGASNRTIIS